MDQKLLLVLSSANCILLFKQTEKQTNKQKCRKTIRVPVRLHCTSVLLLGKADHLPPSALLQCPTDGHTALVSLSGQAFWPSHGVSLLECAIPIRQLSTLIKASNCAKTFQGIE